MISATLKPKSSKISGIVDLTECIKVTKEILIYNSVSVIRSCKFAAYYLKNDIQISGVKLRIFQKVNRVELSVI
jgi:hypothetical protein